MAAKYTERQGQYLAFIYYYSKINGRPPAEADMQRYLQASAPGCAEAVAQEKPPPRVEPLA